MRMRVRLIKYKKKVRLLNSRVSSFLSYVGSRHNFIYAEMMLLFNFSIFTDAINQCTF